MDKFKWKCCDLCQVICHRIVASQSHNSFGHFLVSAVVVSKINNPFPCKGTTKNKRVSWLFFSVLFWSKILWHLFGYLCFRSLCFLSISVVVLLINLFIFVFPLLFYESSAGIFFFVCRKLTLATPLSDQIKGKILSTDKDNMFRVPCHQDSFELGKKWMAKGAQHKNK